MAPQIAMAQVNHRRDAPSRNRKPMSNPCFSFFNYTFVQASDDKGRSEFSKFLQYHGDLTTCITCPYCESTIETHWSGQFLVDAEDYFCENIHLVVCNICSWHWFRAINPEIPIAEHCFATYSKVDISSADAPLSEIRRHLLRDFKLLREISAGRAEDLVASVFKEAMNCEVRYITNGVFARDGGIDFVLVNTAQGLECAFQVKRRKTDNPEPITEIREFLGAVAMSPYRKCYYVTTASRFKSSAKEIAAAESALRSRNLECVLVNGDELSQIIRKHRIGSEAIGKLTTRLIFPYDWKRVIPRNRNDKLDSLIDGLNTQEMLAIAFEQDAPLV